MITGVRGAPDILPDEVPAWRRVEETARRLLEAYGYREIRTPIFERTELFVRGIGEGTDIVDKEMYTFRDMGEESLTLRPEGTAPAVRAYLEHSLAGAAAEKPPLLKLYYLGPMFRHEKPQSGRFRQFHQVGAEAIGSENPAVDVEVLALLHHFFEELTISGLSLHLNSIGCRQCRPAIRERFVAFVTAREKELCADCRVRLACNPLRILDCKNPSCQALMADAPRPAQDLCAACISHFGEVQRLLTLLGISFVLNDRLVRGLDYYSRTTFEFVNPRLGAQNALAGGGRYDGLVEELGGPPTPAVGFALGIERVVASLPKTRAEERDAVSGVYIATVGAAAWEAGVLLVQELRYQGIHALLDLEGRSLRGQMRQANKEKVRYCLILGEEELAKKTVTVKEMATGTQETVPRSGVTARLRSGLGGGA